MLWAKAKRTVVRSKLWQKQQSVCEVTENIYKIERALRIVIYIVEKQKQKQRKIKI